MKSSASFMQTTDLNISPNSSNLIVDNTSSSNRNDWSEILTDHVITFKKIGQGKFVVFTIYIEIVVDRIKKFGKLYRKYILSYQP